MYHISMYTQDEIGGVEWEDDHGKKLLTIYPYEKSPILVNKVSGKFYMEAGFDMIIPPTYVYMDDKVSFTGKPTRAFHTHPGRDGYPQLGYPHVSAGDERVMRANYKYSHVNIPYYIFSQKVTGHTNRKNQRTIGKHSEARLFTIEGGNGYIDYNLYGKD